MSKRSVLTIGVALIAAAIAVWVFVGRGGDDASKEAGSAARTVEGPQATRPAPARADAPASDVVLVDDDPPGALRLEGQVLDAKDQPVAGATVILSSNPSRTATTEDDGSFAFDGLVGRPYRVAARAPAGVAGPVTARLTATSEPVILRLRPASSVTVEIVDEAGKPVDAATVELRGLDTQTATTRAGTVTIAPVIAGWYQLAAWAPGYARAYQWLDVEGESTSVRVALRRGAAVSGRVVDDAGAPVAGARVTFGGVSEWSIQIDERRDGQVTDAEGRFAFDALAAGSVRFDARHPDFAPGSSGIVTLDGKTPVDDVEIVLPAGAVVSGTVVDTSKRPVASARVRIGVAGASFVAGPPRQVFSADDGTFTVRGLPRRALEAVAVSDAGASDTVAIDAASGAVSGVTIVVDVTGTIAGVVVDPAGEPVEGVQVSAGPDFRSGRAMDPTAFRLRGFPEDLTDAGGHFTLTGLAPGDYRVTATRSPRRRGPAMFAGDAVFAKTGDQGVKIVLPLDGGLKGKVAFDDGTTPRQFTVQVGFVAEPVASDDGTFVVDELPPGDQDVTIRGNGFEPRRVTAKVEPGKTSDLGVIVVRKGRTVRGTVVSGGAPVAGATVWAGSQIFGNGTSNDARFGGPPGGRDTRSTTTDEQGRFSMSGFGKRDVTLVAEHTDIGRSKALRLPAGDPAEQDLVIVLQPFGSLSGKVTSDGVAADGVIVSVQSTTAPNAMYGVASGADGAFRLDRLAPDAYKVSAMSGMNPMTGMGFFSRTVTVESGKETTVDVAMKKGALTLLATPRTPDGAPAGGFGWIATGTVTARNGKDLQLKLAQQDLGFSEMAVMISGNPARFPNLSPGTYTVCLLPLPAGVQGPAAMRYAMEHGDELPAFCKGVTMTESPAEQRIDVDVVQPEKITEE